MGYDIIKIAEAKQEVTVVKHEVREDVLKRLNYIDGHLAGVRRMIEEDKYCPEILKQTFAVRRAIEKMEALILDGHLHTCVIDGIKNGREDQVVQELQELYTLANR
jgi:DNA-binding FrmR family transcriptional regulator